MNRKKRVPNFAKQKRAFDQVMEAYRTTTAPFLGCRNLKLPALAVRDLAKPTPSEFRCDVQLVIASVVAARYHPWFYAVYSWYENPDALAREMFAQRMLGDRRHSWEQRLGARFIKIGLYPTRTYFSHTRA